jgi:hypothetical protein
MMLINVAGSLRVSLIKSGKKKGNGGGTRMTTDEIATDAQRMQYLVLDLVGDHYQRQLAASLNDSTCGKCYQQP